MATSSRDRPNGEKEEEEQEEEEEYQSTSPWPGIVYQRRFSEVSVSQEFVSIWRLCPSGIASSSFLINDDDD